MKRKNLKIKGISVVLLALLISVLSCKEAPKEQPKDMEISEVSMKVEEPFLNCLWPNGPCIKWCVKMEWIHIHLPRRPRIGVLQDWSM